MKFIFLDTNIFFNDYYLRYANFKYLFNYIENTGSVLLVSEVVIEEIENIYNREVDDIARSLKKELKRSKSFTLLPLKINLNELTDRKYNFKNVLTSKTYDIKFIPYNNVEHKEVVQRALKRIKPFQEGEKGYRDTLIWLSFLSFLSENKIRSEVAFITNNSKDFLNKQKTDIHDDLKNDIQILDLKCKITPYNSLHEFININVDKEQHEFSESQLYDEHFTEIEDELETEAIEFINNLSPSQFKNYTDNNTSDSFPHISSLIELSFEILEGVEDPEILYFTRLSKNALYVGYNYNLRRCYFYFTIPSSDYYANQEEINNFYSDIEIEGNLVTLSAFARTYLDVSFEYNLDSKSISGYSIDTLNHI